MFSGRSLIRILIDPVRFMHHPLCTINIGANGRNSCDKLTWALTRCYVKDSKNSLAEPTKSDENDSVVKEESMEIFDIEKERNKLNLGGDLSKYTVFKDEESPIILDVEEERLALKFKEGLVLSERTDFDDISLQRGICGVFDVEELVSILKHQSAKNIVVIKVPKTFSYADHMVIISGKSSRHLLAMASYVRQLFKKKMQEGDKIPIIEGKKNKNENWFALDLGNIILHLFLKSTREEYDLESLWSLGPEFDPHLNRSQDPLDAIIKKHSQYLEDLQPADASN